MTDPRRPETLVDLDRYPLHDLEGAAGQRLIAQVKSDLADDGAASLPAFLRPEGLALMVAEAEALAPFAYRGPTEVSPYFFNYDLAENEPPDHPTRRMGKRNLSQVAYDLIPPESALYRLYHWELLPVFLSRVLGYDALYRYADPYQSLNISVMGEGGCQQWHFDRGAFVTTLLLQSAEEGGDFEYVPRLRSDENENFAAVARILDGDESRVRRIKMDAGTLNLFQGHYSMHRVSEVKGKRLRLQTILSYNPEPGVTGSLKSSLMHYGPRVAIREGLGLEALRDQFA